MITLQEEDFERLTKIVNEAIEKHSRSDEHIALESMILRDNRHAEMWHKFKLSMIGLVTISFFGWIGTLILKGLGLELIN